MPSLILVAPERAMRISLQEELVRVPEVRLIGSVPTWDAAAEEARDTGADVLLGDASEPLLGGPGSAADIHRAGAAICLYACCTVCPRDRALVTALERASVEVVTLPPTSDRLRSALDQTAQRRRVTAWEHQTWCAMLALSGVPAADIPPRAVPTPPAVAPPRWRRWPMRLLSR